ncbi:MAG: LptA/OstA family protein [Candidatus Pacebacteria bacterium]|nr:LptA/OstA family protein [Candidatus Paceibacterota bacterium]
MTRQICFFIGLAFWLTLPLVWAQESGIVLRPPPPPSPASPSNRSPTPTPTLANSAKPDSTVQSNIITVTANQGIDWEKLQRLFIARGGAVIRNGDSTIAADLIYIFYDQAKGSSGKSSSSPVFTRIATSGNTVINQRGNLLTGTSANIYLDTMEMVVVGNGLSLTTSSGEVITATGSLEYRDVTQLAVARGNAKAVQGERTMVADTITASLSPASQQRQFTRINGFGKVFITSPDQAASGDRASFDLVKNFAVLSGNVKLGQGANILVGDYGEMDMTSGVTRILMGKDAGSASQKLRAVIVPNDLRSKTPTEPTVRPK